MAAADAWSDGQVQAAAAPTLTVGRLSVQYGEGDGAVRAVRDVSFSAQAGETVGIVGESGSGKSTAVMAVAGLLPRSARVNFQSLSFGATELTGTRGGGPNEQGSQIGVIYQDALRALNPVMQIGHQIAEGLRARGISHTEARKRTVEMLDRVGIPDPSARLRSYPHQLSGGMRQRVVIAMALIEHPRLIIADEPTTALDVTVQAQVLDLIKGLSEEIGSTTLLVTHDLGVVAGTCDRVVVMYDGEVVEQGSVGSIFTEPSHPYTRALLSSVPDPDRRAERLPFIPGVPPEAGTLTVGCSFADRCDHAVELCHTTQPALTSTGPDHLAACHLPDGVPRGPVVVPPAQVSPNSVVDPVQREVLVDIEGLVKTYSVGGFAAGRRPAVRAVDGLDLKIFRGETLGLVGESGCGKSTLGRLLVGLERPESGMIRFDGQDVAGLGRRGLREHRRRAQMIYQDPKSSLNRRMTIGSMLAEALRLHGVPRPQIGDRAADLLEMVGLSAAHLPRYPHEFSGGQSQRLAIARSLALDPRFLVADEAVSALDVSVQGQVLNLLHDLKQRLDLTVLFVSHDLGVVRQICDRVAVMYLGRVVEEGTTEEIFHSPSHPYTVALRSAIPVPDPASSWSKDRILLAGDPPRPTAPPTGCRFHPRCPMGPTAVAGREICATEVPLLETSGLQCRSACHFREQVAEELAP